MVNIIIITPTCIIMTHCQVADLRSGGEEFFVATVPPHKPVSSKMLARWMTAVLQGGGVDTSVWKQHSSRSAGAAHHREVRGLSYKDLCAMADWSLCSATYTCFYKRYY